MQLTSDQKAFISELGLLESRLLEADPASLHRAYAVLCQFAPTLARVPAIAAPWLRAAIGMHSNGCVSMGEVRNLLETQKLFIEVAPYFIPANK
jgi:hypothetical protein